jgi:hypothetical protein
MDVAYSLDPVDGVNSCYSGIILNERYIDQMGVRARILKKLRDLEELKSICDELGLTTGFELEQIKNALKTEVVAQDWRIAELLAECFLEDHRNARFYCNSIRDTKNPKTFATGADLVGFMDIDNATVFLFGETKLSKQHRWPPSVVYGEGGLRAQLEDLIVNEETRGALVRWLLYKAASNSAHREKFRNDLIKAIQTYHMFATSSARIKCVGVMVRQKVDPDEKDLQAVHSYLAPKLEEDMHLELLALYTPKMDYGYITTLCD